MSEPGAPQTATLAVLWDGTGLRHLAAPGGDEPLAAGPLDGVAPSGPASVRLAAPGRAEVVPGSIFDWKPVAASPDHGFAPLDRLIRRLMQRKSEGYKAGYVLTNASPRDDARVFFYGERHTDRALIRENMRRLATDVRPGRGALILDEAYFGPRLFGSAALRYLQAKGLDPESLETADLQVDGWDDPAVYGQSNRLSLQYHMDLLELNHQLHSPTRGVRYYADFARRAYAALRDWLVLRWRAIARRNIELDRSVRSALAEADAAGKSLHVIAGAEHLLGKPWWSQTPLLGRVRFRPALRRALGGRPYWAGKPPDSP